ncbi:MAG: TonB family protein [Pseudohongiellaceae bacterium]
MKAFANNLIKFNTIILFAALLTFLLFYFMQYLIATNDNISPKILVTKIIDATVPEFQRELFLDIEAPAPIPEEEIVPPQQEKVFSANLGLSLPTTVITEPLALTGSGINIGMADNIMIPLIRTTANYPQRALARGIKGFVELSFTVSALGDVEDPVVTYSEPQGVFDRAALQSIRRWKYSAAVENGEAIPTYDVRQRIVFEMDGAQ